MDQEQFQALLRFFQVLGNESRLKIIGLLANNERSVGELAELLDVKEPTVSHHLAQLKGLDLVTVRPDGTSRFYTLNARALETMGRDIFSARRLNDLVEPEEGPSWEQKVLRAFMDGDRIKELPAKEKKLLVILRWLLDKFEPDRHYHEAEVNAIIKRHHPDTASLRRAFIEYKLMARERGEYWRIDKNGENSAESPLPA